MMVVNRRCAPADIREVTVTLNASQLNGTHSYLVKDMYTREGVATNSRSSPSFTTTLQPGQGKLFRIEPWDDHITLTGDVTVPAGVVLTLDPGTTVEAVFDDGQTGGTWPDRAELIVHGTLNVNGADGEGNEVTFRSDDEEHPTYLSVWGGLRVEAGGNATFRYAHIRNATRAVHLNGAIGSVDWGTDPDAETVIEYSHTGL